jgi:hypothetical protein
MLVSAAETGARTTVRSSVVTESDKIFFMVFSFFLMV